ncbi:hypothetical protein BKA62DRAFT_718260 [Auriculariales sp. MPI-PUGE-AT-0066]|nr:hypothetical protein BKA62DRAFT_718260 [Auriculariales sp. MPI-PUGE-AT-0066]
MSAPSSPRIPLQRRLSSRRGSVSAPDPFGLHPAQESEIERAQTSRLTIVRVPSAGGASSTAQTPPESPALSKRNSWGSRRGSGSSLADGNGGKPRLSFAFSTFTPINPPAAPTTHEIGRPAGKQRTYSNSNLVPFAGRKNLTPEQLLELAQNPVGSTPAVSPGPTTNEHGFEPAPFTPLASEIWLPFLDRPKEVTALITNPPTKQLFALICQSLPTDSGSDDPAKWTAERLTDHLTKTTREQSDDRAWTQTTRDCISAHSELLWERFKGALGVPPELDEDPLLDEDLFSYSPGGVDHDTAVDDEYDDSLSGSVDVEETWVEPIYTTSELGAQIPLTSPRLEGLSDLEAIGEREEESASGSRTPNEPVQGIRIFTSTVSPEFPTSRRRYSHSHLTPAGDGDVSVSPLSLGSGSGSLGLGRSQSLSDARRRFSSGIHLTQAGSSGLSRSRSLQQGTRGVGALGGASSNRMVAPHTERSPGNPLFVSSFATLSAGPTLVANNPSLRYSLSPMHAPRIPSRLGRGSDYAVSVTSESDRGGT